MNELLALSQKIPVAGERGAERQCAGASNALRQSRARYSDAGAVARRRRAVVRRLDRAAEAEPGHPQLAAKRSNGVQKAATEVRALVPQLLQSLGNVASALGSPGVDGMTRHLERFELTGLRLQQDMEALAGGVGDATVIARRLADGNDYMGQVVGGLAARIPGSACRSVTGADALTRFKATSALYAQLSEKVRTAISSADRVKLAREASCSAGHRAATRSTRTSTAASACRRPAPACSAARAADRPAGRRRCSRC